MVSICLCVYFLYDAAYIKKVPSGTAPYPFLFLSAIGGNLVALYLIEKSEKNYQRYLGYIGLLIFFVVAFGGVFLGW